MKEIAAALDADQVRALVASKWPEAMQSPLAQAVGAFCAADEADRAVEFASLQARVTFANGGPKPCGDGCNGCAFCRRDEDTPAERCQVLADAMGHADACIAACGGWTVETLSHNVESAFGMELDVSECDDIAREAMTRAGLLR